MFRCKHDWVIHKRSNAIQCDDMGYPLRLVIMKCSKCGKTEQSWLDINISALEEIKTGKLFLLKWEY